MVRQPFRWLLLSASRFHKQLAAVVVLLFVSVLHMRTVTVFGVPHCVVSFPALQFLVAIYAGPFVEADAFRQCYWQDWQAWDSPLEIKREKMKPLFEPKPRMQQYCSGSWMDQFARYFWEE